MIIGLNFLLLIAAAFVGSDLAQLAAFDSMGEACTDKAAAVLSACPQLVASAALDGGPDELRAALASGFELGVSQCRTQLFWALSEIVHDCSVVLAAILVFTGVHWIKYMELVPRLALPIHTLTATALDLGALFIVVTMLLICALPALDANTSRRSPV